MSIYQARNVGLPLMNVVRMDRASILQQLHLEEKLLRTSSENWCIINDGTNDPTIVMGISGKPGELLEVPSVLQDKIPVIRRFTGGDYVFGNRKFGGNAQSITKNRWIHHTSFLWDYEERNMKYLRVPSRAPKYRLERDHSEFICRMKEFLPRSEFIDGTIKAAGTHFTLRSIPWDAIQTPATANFSPSSRILTRQELEAAVHTEPERFSLQSV